jgi:hypothetical protein
MASVKSSVSVGTSLERLIDNDRSVSVNDLTLTTGPEMTLVRKGPYSMSVQSYALEPLAVKRKTKLITLDSEPVAGNKNAFLSIWVPCNISPLD